MKKNILIACLATAFLQGGEMKLNVNVNVIDDMNKPVSDAGSVRKVSHIFRGLIKNRGRLVVGFVGWFLSGQLRAAWSPGLAGRNAALN